MFGVHQMGAHVVPSPTFHPPWPIVHSNRRIQNDTTKRLALSSILLMGQNLEAYSVNTSFDALVES